MMHYGKVLALYFSVSAYIVRILHHPHLTPHWYTLTNKSLLIHSHRRKFILRLIFDKYPMYFNKCMMVCVYHFIVFVLHWKPSLSSILFYVSKTGRFLFLSELLLALFCLTTLPCLTYFDFIYTNIEIFLWFPCFSPNISS